MLVTRSTAGTVVVAIVAGVIANSCTASAQERDPCHLSAVSRPASKPRPPGLEAVLLEKSKDTYMAALVAWMKAKNELDAAENELRSRDQNASVRRMRAESSHTSATLKDLSSQMNELDLVCAQIVEARTELARQEGGTGREIDLLRKETDDVRRLLSGGGGAIQSRYEAETTRLTSEVSDPSQLKKRFTSDLDTAKRERDRLRTQVGPK